MHSLAQVLSFVTFSAVLAGTPGPGNALLTVAGARVGVRRGLITLLGQVTGMSALLFAVTLGFGGLLLAHPVALQALKWAGVALLGWMAWRIASSGPGGAAVRVPTGFLGMAAFQWVNPKGWLVAVAAVATFLDRRDGGALAQAAVFALLFALTAIPSCLPWLVSGAALQRFLRTPRARRVFNVVMAVLLAASAVPLILTRVLCPSRRLGRWVRGGAKRTGGTAPGGTRAGRAGRRAVVPAR